MSAAGRGSGEGIAFRADLPNVPCDDSSDEAPFARTGSTSMSDASDHHTPIKPSTQRQLPQGENDTAHVSEGSSVVTSLDHVSEAHSFPNGNLNTGMSAQVGPSSTSPSRSTAHIANHDNSSSMPNSGLNVTAQTSSKKRLDSELASSSRPSTPAQEDTNTSSKHLGHSVSAAAATSLGSPGLRYVSSVSSFSSLSARSATETAVAGSSLGSTSASTRRDSLDPAPPLTSDEPSQTGDVVSEMQSFNMTPLPVVELAHAQQVPLPILIETANNITATSAIPRSYRHSLVLPNGDTEVLPSHTQTESLSPPSSQPSSPSRLLPYDRDAGESLNRRQSSSVASTRTSYHLARSGSPASSSSRQYVSQTGEASFPLASYVTPEQLQPNLGSGNDYDSESNTPELSHSRHPSTPPLQSNLPPSPPISPGTDTQVTRAGSSARIADEYRNAGSLIQDNRPSSNHSNAPTALGSSTSATPPHAHEFANNDLPSSRTSPRQGHAHSPIQPSTPPSRPTGSSKEGRPSEAVRGRERDQRPETGTPNQTEGGTRDKEKERSRRQLGEWTLGKTLGAGSMGKVKLGVSKISGEKVNF